MTDADFQAELSVASKVKMEIYDGGGEVSSSVELRGAAIVKIQQLLHDCHCEPAPVLQPGLRELIKRWRIEAAARYWTKSERGMLTSCADELETLLAAPDPRGEPRT